ncbi:MAG: hypothetical protein HOI43_14700 [Gammaproteobacteria bacterium]|nr:hypothetical protein [Gammaproteobacteria bacterium]
MEMEGYGARGNDISCSRSTKLNTYQIGFPGAEMTSSSASITPPTRFSVRPETPQRIKFHRAISRGKIRDHRNQ